MGKENPFRGVVDLMSEMRRMRHLGKTGHDADYEDHERTHSDAWVPTADIFARGEDLVIWLELPGLQRDAIDITFSGGVLTVSGERDAGPELSDVIFWRRERYYGTFSWTIGLPEEVSDRDISASSRDGLVVIMVRGACASTDSPSRRIPIGDGSS